MSDEGAAILEVGRGAIADRAFRFSALGAGLTVLVVLTMVAVSMTWRATR